LGYRKGGALQAAEKLIGTVILSIDSALWLPMLDRQKLDWQNPSPNLSS